VTFPAASIFTHPLTTVAGPDGGGYGSLEQFVQHAIEIERHLVAGTIAAGARYVQFDGVLVHIRGGIYITMTPQEALDYKTGAFIPELLRWAAKREHELRADLAL
jgi:hypothetical protein